MVVIKKVKMIIGWCWWYHQAAVSEESSGNENQNSGRGNPFLFRLKRLSRQIANTWPQRAVKRLEVDALHAPLPHPEADIMQPRKRTFQSVLLPATTAQAVRQRVSSPENFSPRCSPRPHDRVEVLWARLLGPEGLFAC